MDLRQLEYFVRVAELGSFTRAAIALDIAQPALSRQVRLLEVELRQNLLTRNGRVGSTIEEKATRAKNPTGSSAQTQKTKGSNARSDGNGHRSQASIC